MIGEIRKRIKRPLKKRRLKWLEEEAEAHMRPVRWKAKGRQ